MKIGDFMQNKRGFTLIEVMGVILVLALVLLVTAPTLLKSIKKGEEKQYDAFLEDLYLATESYIQSNKDQYKELLTIGGTIGINIETLQNENLIKHTLKNPNTGEDVTKQSYVEITVKSDGTYTYRFVDVASSAASYVEKFAKSTELLSDTESTGLDTSKPYTSRKYYVGENPSNHLIFSGNCFSIIHITQNHSIKLIYEGKASTNTCNRSKDNGSMNPLAWNSSGIIDFESSNIKGLLESASTTGTLSIGRDVVELIKKEDLALVEKAIWYTGASSSSSLQERIESERQKQYINSKIGILNTSDYLKIGGSNYLSKSYGYWTINPSNAGGVFIINNTEVTTSNVGNPAYLRPVIYLSARASITSGDGSAANPYVVS